GMIELIYVLFLLSGLIKAFLNFLGFGSGFIDFTLVCAIILVGWYILHYSRNFFFGNLFHIIRSSRSIVFTVLVFYLWMAITLIYTRSPGYCYTKIFLFLTVVLAVIFPFIYRGFDASRFFHWFSYMGTSLIFVYTALFPSVYESYLKDIEYRGMVIKYLDIGYLAGALILILALAFACPRMKPFIKLGLIGINAWTLMVCAARGPLLFLVFVLLIKFTVSFVAFMKSRKLNLKNILYMAAGLGIFAGAFYYLMDRYALLLERSVSRLLLLLDPQAGSSIVTRISQVSFSIDKIFENAGNFLLGLGIGSFGILYEGEDVRLYPHNAILEIGFELGIVGVILFILLVFLYFKKIRFNLNFLLIFVYLFLNSMKSYSLVDSRVMFGILSVLILYHTLPFTHPGTTAEMKK
ncbi:MAG: hypothetical protein JSV88_09760, partial [Candidatus Aminicenantes bacterium]